MNKLRRFSYCLLCTFVLMVTLSQVQILGQTTATVRVPQTTDSAKISAASLLELQNDLSAILADEKFSSALVGAHVVSLKTNEVLYKFNENKALVPASTMKLFTTAAALDQLSSEFTYTTTLYLDGIVKRSGEFIGNIVVRGVGDPTMSEYFTNPLSILQEWSKALDSLGIKGIRGNIIGDDSYFDDVSYAPGTVLDDLSYSYCPEVSALSFFDNKFTVTAVPNENEGDSAKISIHPNIPDSYSLVNNTETITENSEQTLDVYRVPFSNEITISGGIPQKNTRKRSTDSVSIGVTIHNPALAMMRLFKRVLEEKGIIVYGEALDTKDRRGEKIDYTELRPVVRRTSPNLGKIIKVINSHSHNLCAEILLKTLGKEVSGEGSFTAGTEAVRKFFVRSGIPSEGFFNVDGSGLSRMNFVAPRHLTGVLGAMYRSRHKSIFLESLAQPGEKGTLASRFKSAVAKKNVFAKTGSMNNVCTLAGYLFTRDKEPIAFSVMLNNFSASQSVARSLQDIFVLRLLNFSRKINQ